MLDCVPSEFMDSAEGSSCRSSNFWEVAAAAVLIGLHPLRWVAPQTLRKISYNSTQPLRCGKCKNKGTSANQVDDIIDKVETHFDCESGIPLLISLIVHDNGSRGTNNHRTMMHTFPLSSIAKARSTTHLPFHARKKPQTKLVYATSSTTEQRKQR